MKYGFARIAADFAEEPFFHLLYVGGDSDASTDLLAAARESGWFEKVLRVEPRRDDLIDVDELAKAEELYVGVFRGCLVVVWDFDGLWPSYGDSALRNTARIAERVQQARKWSQQVIGFGLTTTTPPASSFLELAELIAGDVAAVGDAGTCLETLRRWCAPSRETLGLRASFQKGPSGWLRYIKHDYLNNGVLSSRLRPALDATGLADRQPVIDFWQNALRNVLIDVRSNVRARAFTAEGIDDEPEIVRTLHATAFQLVAPDCLEEDLRKVGFVAGEDYSVYTSSSDAVARVGKLRKEGTASVLLWQDSLEPPRLEGLEGRARVTPTVLVGRDEPPRADWHLWRQLFSRNVLGGFSREELLRPGPRRVSILECKPSCWRPFCFQTLAGAVDEIRDRMIETYLGLSEHLSDGQRKKLHRSAAEVEAAHEHYFGPSVV